MMNAANRIVTDDRWSDCVCVQCDKTDLDDDSFDAALCVLM